MLLTALPWRWFLHHNQRWTKPKLRNSDVLETKVLGSWTDLWRFLLVVPLCFPSVQQLRYCL